MKWNNSIIMDYIEFKIQSEMIKIILAKNESGTQAIFLDKHNNIIESQNLFFNFVKPFIRSVGVNKDGFLQCDILDRTNDGIHSCEKIVFHKKKLKKVKV